MSLKIPSYWTRYGVIPDMPETITLGLINAKEDGIRIGREQGKQEQIEDLEVHCDGFIKKECIGDFNSASYDRGLKHVLDWLKSQLELNSSAVAKSDTKLGSEKGKEKRLSRLAQHKTETPFHMTPRPRKSEAKVQMNIDVGDGTIRYWLDKAKARKERQEPQEPPDKGDLDGRD